MYPYVWEQIVASTAFGDAGGRPMPLLIKETSVTDGFVCVPKAGRKMSSYKAVV